MKISPWLKLDNINKKQTNEKAARQNEYAIITNLKVTARVIHVPQGEISLSVSILINLHQTSDTWENQETKCLL